uniref:growth/differentiation factor 6-A n=1 Tax=Scatophagus argus TaxID=75038 RepID=UPI001ED8182E|nr:growth/differentiation factor 6-A [Scatophagus argus]
MDRAVVWFVFCLALCVGMESAGAPQSGPLTRSDTSLWRNDRPVNDSVVLHDYMVFLYRALSKLQRRHDSRGFANTVTSFVDQGKDLSSWDNGQRYIFDLSSWPRMDKLVEAELRILRNPAVDVLSILTTGGNLYNIRLYSCSAEGASDRQLLDSRTIEVLDGSLPRWEVFDVWTNMKAHQTNPTESTQACFHLLALSQLTNEVADPLLLGLDRHTRLPQERALLVAFSHADTTDGLFRDMMHKRLPTPLKAIPKDEKMHWLHHKKALSKRSFSGTGGGSAVAGTERKTGHRGIRCSRKPLHVNFKGLGWDDWIIAPLDYEAYHCDGVCDFPLRSHLEPTNHAVIQTLMNSMDPDISPPSCCVPSKLSPISILYIDSGNNVVYKQYKDMVVESCGCR